MSGVTQHLSSTSNEGECAAEMLGRLLMAGRPAPFWKGRAWEPPTDVYQTKDAVIVRMELACVDPERIEIGAHSREVVVRGVREDCHKGCKVQVAQMEIAYGPFERVIPMHVPISPRQAQARYQAGMLEIVLPKAERARTVTRQVIIRLL